MRRVSPTSKRPPLRRITMKHIDPQSGMNVLWVEQEDMSTHTHYLIINQTDHPRLWDIMKDDHPQVDFIEDFNEDQVDEIQNEMAAAEIDPKPTDFTVHKELHTVVY
jgi:hypothetical protein